MHLSKLQPQTQSAQTKQNYSLKELCPLMVHKTYWRSLSTSTPLHQGAMVSPLCSCVGYPKHTCILFWSTIHYILIVKQLTVSNNGQCNKKSQFHNNNEIWNLIRVELKKCQTQCTLYIKGEKQMRLWTSPPQNSVTTTTMETYFKNCTLNGLSDQWQGLT